MVIYQRILGHGPRISYSYLNILPLKVYHLSGFVYKQVGAFEKSLSAYLKAYVLDDKHRLETANKISKMCYLMIEHLKEDATGQ